MSDFFENGPSAFSMLIGLVVQVVDSELVDCF